MPSCIFDRLQRILFFVDKIADEIVCEETELLEKTIPRMFEVMQMVAKFSCTYVKRGRFGERHLLWTWQVLIIAERTVGGMIHPGRIEDMDSGLTQVIEDFDRAVNVEALRSVKVAGKHSCRCHTIVHS